MREPIPHFRLLSADVYDPPVFRVALVCWRPSEARWFVQAASRGDRQRLIDLGELLCGPQPWAQALIIELVGRLGSVEAAAAALAPPSDPVVVRARPVRVPVELLDGPHRVPVVERRRRRRVLSPDQGRLL